MAENYIYRETAGAPLKMWTRGVPVEDGAQRQLDNVAGLPFIFKHVAVMPDVHYGKGATVGSVIPTKGAIIPAAVGVDIGCGMIAARTNLTANDLPGNLLPLRLAIEAAVPVGDASHKEPPASIEARWRSNLLQRYWPIEQKHSKIVGKTPPACQLGTLGGGNHFVEVCIASDGRVWIMLHSGSRGIGNRIGQYFIAQAKREMERLFVRLPDRDLAYLAEGSELFDDYVEAVGWAQDYAAENRKVMMGAVVKALQKQLKRLEADEFIVNCHHNYVEREHHFDHNVWVTRKGAVRARDGEFGIIPARWARGPMSCAARATRTRSIPARTGPAARCHAVKRNVVLPSRITAPPPRASNAAKTRGSSTRRRALTSRSRQSLRRRATSSRSCTN